MNIRLLEECGQVLIDVEDLFAFGYKLVVVVNQPEVVADEDEVFLDSHSTPFDII